VGGATTAATSAAGTATITTTSAHNIGSGDLVVVAGITPPGFNGTYVVTTVPSATAISYVNATSGPQTVAGTISVYAQTSIVSRSAATTGLVVRGATSQASNLQEWQNTGGAIASVSSAGIIRGVQVNTNTDFATMREANSGGYLRLTKATASTVQTATTLGFFVLTGTNANTLKIVVRSAGADTTLLDNIPTA
jgi:hypothetical protein